MNTIFLPHDIPNLKTAGELVAFLSTRADLPFDVAAYDSQGEWLEARKSHIGASEASIVLGINSFKSREQLFNEKIGRSEDTFRGNEQTRIGQIAEPMIRAMWALEHPDYTVYDPTNLLFESRARPWQSCSLDMVVEHCSTGNIYIGEIKTGLATKHWKSRYCPDGYFAQICHELAVTGFDGAFLLGRIRPMMDMSVDCFAYEKSFFYSADNPTLVSEQKKIIACEEKFAADLQSGVLRPALNLIV